jgi:hypothetical protein
MIIAGILYLWHRASSPYKPIYLFLNQERKMKMAKTLSAIAILGTLASCGGGGGTSTYGLYSSPYITANGFVNALNDVDGAPVFDESEVILYTDETIRSATPGEEDWFVIYDAKYDEYKAVSLQYVRALSYYDYYSNNFSTADEFRQVESDDIFAGFTNGDLFGDDYEVADLIGGVFYGRESGFAYEDEVETMDVNLMAGEKERVETAKKVMGISLAYSVSPEAAYSLASLGKKVETMVKKGASQEELTEEDQAVLMKDLEHITGVTLEEVIAAGVTEAGKQEVFNKVADKLGTSAQNVEDKILPELFGLK